MDEQLTTLRPKHDMRRAINYMTTRSECFERFLEDGNIPFDNNASERAVKTQVVGKTNWLFFGSPAGGNAADLTSNTQHNRRSAHKKRRSQTNFENAL
jgi:hypothetical protein